jgi:flagellar protein FliO/FliZ
MDKSVTQNMLQRLSHVSIALVLSLVICPLDVFAVEQTQKISNADYMSSDYLLQMIVGLVLVLVCIIALAWFAKRFRYMQSSSVASMQILGGISMGARERVVLMQVGSTRLLLGVAPGCINTLHVMDQTFDDAELADETATSVEESFATRLGSALMRSGKK